MNQKMVESDTMLHDQMERDKWKKAPRLPLNLQQRCVFTGIVEEMIQDVYMVGYDKQKEGIKTPIRKLLREL